MPCSGGARRGNIFDLCKLACALLVPRICVRGTCLKHVCAKLRHRSGSNAMQIETIHKSKICVSLCTFGAKDLQTVCDGAKGNTPIVSLHLHTEGVLGVSGSPFACALPFTPKVCGLHKSKICVRNYLPCSVGANSCTYVSQIFDLCSTAQQAKDL